MNSEKPYTLEEVFEIFRTELDIDLEALLSENSITSSDIQEQVEQDSQSAGVSAGFGGGAGLFEGLDDEGLPGNFGRGLGFSNLSTTSGSIMSIIFTQFGGSSNSMGVPPTPPPMPVFSTRPGAVWGSWNAWSKCSAECGGGSRRRYRACKKYSSNASCSGTNRQVGFCNTHSCRK